MSVTSYEELKWHIGHKIECVRYGHNAENVALECVDCSEVLISFDKPMWSKKGKKLWEGKRTKKNTS